MVSNIYFEVGNCEIEDLSVWMFDRNVYSLVILTNAVSAVTKFYVSNIKI